MTPDVDKPRLLFVDDEPDVLGALRQSLRRERRRWDIDFAQGGPAALERLAAAPFDVVVTDMRMPEMDGAELLSRVKRDHPGAVRLVLSGQADERHALRSISSAHLWLSKPCPHHELVDALERAIASTRCLRSKALSKLIGGVSSLPSPPTQYAALMRALDDPDPSAQSVAAVLEEDPAMSAKILQLTSSAFFSTPRAISTVHEAVALLGFQTVSQLVLTCGVFEQLESGPQSAAAAEERRVHSVLVARIARRIGEHVGVKASECFTAGMLHDIGELLLASRLDRLFHKAVEKAHADAVPRSEIERAMFGATHAELGAHLIARWGLPLSIVDAVLQHDSDGALELPARTPLGAVVRAADALADEALGVGELDFAHAPLRTDEPGIDGLGDLEPLRAIAREEAAPVGGPRAAAKESTHASA
ncbi:MAG: response regulator [Myxococcota bacterium]|nr:HDOD domain-containing protein [Myxococcales bacterium]